MTLQDELVIEPTEADEAAFFAGVEKIVNEIRKLAEKHGVNNDLQPTCNVLEQVGPTHETGRNYKFFMGNQKMIPLYNSCLL